MRDRERWREGGRGYGPTWHTGLAFLAVRDIVHGGEGGRGKDGEGERRGRDSGIASALDVRGKHLRFKTGGGRQS